MTPEFTMLRAGNIRPSGNPAGIHMVEEMAQSLWRLQYQIHRHVTPWLDLFERTGEPNDPFLFGLSGQTLLIAQEAWHGNALEDVINWNDVLSFTLPYTLGTPFIINGLQYNSIKEYMEIHSNEYWHNADYTPKTIYQAIVEMEADATTAIELLADIRQDIASARGKVKDINFVSLVDTPQGYRLGEYPIVNDPVNALGSTATPTRLKTFTSLLDTPDSIGPDNLHPAVEPSGTVTFQEARVQEPWTVHRIQGPTTLQAEQLDRSMIYIIRSLSGYAINLGDTYSGASFEMMISDTGAGGLGDIKVRAAGGNTLETTEITLNGANRYVRLFYEGATRTFYIENLP